MGMYGLCDSGRTQKYLMYFGNVPMATGENVRALCVMRCTL